jgi:hypothetical protein
MIILKVLSTMPKSPNLVPTQDHPLTMPINTVPNALPTPPMHKPDLIPNDVAVKSMPTVTKMTADHHAKTQNHKRETFIEMTTMPQQSASAMNDAHVPSRLLSDVSTKDRAKLAEMQIANERRRRRAVMEAHGEQERRADDPNIINNHGYEPNTKTLVVHERRTKSHQQPQNSEPVD